jgi:hypothetical protein
MTPFEPEAPKLIEACRNHAQDLYRAAGLLKENSPAVDYCNSTSIHDQTTGLWLGLPTGRVSNSAMSRSRLSLAGRTGCFCATKSAWESRARSTSRPLRKSAHYSKADPMRTV